MTTYRNTSLLVAALVMSAPAIAHAQQGPRDPQANSLVRQAMQDYQDLEIDRSIERLNIALRTCGASGCSNAVLSRVHMSIGIVRVGGQQNQAERRNAVQADHVELRHPERRKRQQRHQQ